MKVDGDLARQVIRPRLRESHKGTYGRVLLIGGLYPYGGAIIMAAIACVNSGAGLVAVATDCDNIPALHAHLPEAMAFDFGERDRLLDNLRAANVVLIGSGLGESDAASQVLDLVLENIRPDQDVVVDGSALNLLAKKNKEDLPECHLILTPHQKEWERLSGLAISEQTVSNTQKALGEFQAGTILVAKSHKTAVYQGEKVAHLEVGGPYQATGGMGDTLAGMITGFLAQFASIDRYKAVTVATWLHSAIADDLAKNAYVVLPTHISKAIPSWMKKLSI